MNMNMNTVAAGVLRPDEFTVVSSVFREIVSEPWFSRCPDQQQQFAAQLITSYRKGSIEPRELRRVCIEIARERFADCERTARDA
jgi:hypothetical protein